LTAFMDHCNRRIGEAYFRTPRTTVKAFVQMLAVLDQNPGAKWQELLGDVQITADNHAEDDIVHGDGAQPGDGDDLTSLRIGT
jgi:P-loop Domain of unknown function (DUF2791)